MGMTLARGPLEYDEILDADRYATPEMELEDSELGDRVGWWLTAFELAMCYRTETQRRLQYGLVVLGTITESARILGAIVPNEWIPTEEGALA